MLPVGDFNSDYFRSYEGVTSYTSGKSGKLQDILQQFNHSVMNDTNQPTRV